MKSARSKKTGLTGSHEQTSVPEAESNFLAGCKDQRLKFKNTSLHLKRQQTFFKTLDVWIQGWCMLTPAKANKSVLTRLVPETALSFIPPSFYLSNSGEIHSVWKKQHSVDMCNTSRQPSSFQRQTKDVALVPDQNCHIQGKLNYSTSKGDKRNAWVKSDLNEHFSELMVGKLMREKMQEIKNLALPN